MKLCILARLLHVSILLLAFSAVLLYIMPVQAAKWSLQRWENPNVPTPNEIIARARQWTSIGISYDRYPPYDGPENYRKDCSGMVSMAWMLSNKPSGGLDTTGLAQVAHVITKDQLQVGDILLNTKEDAHAVLFGGWANSDKAAYDALEENGSSYYGYAVEHQIPYPYYTGYNPQDYMPMRLNGVAQGAPVKNQTPSTVVIQKQSPNFSPFVGTWYAHAQAIVINADGKAIYTGRVFVWCVDDQGNTINQPPCDGGGNQGINPNQHALITFTRVVGNTALGTIAAGGTGMRNLDASSRIIPIGSNITVTLNSSNDTLQVSNGMLLCGPQAIKNNVDPGCNSGA
jgi:hypothetical protein